jgi:MATE family multidrug resistance protein
VYTTDPAVLATAAALMVMAAFFQLSDGVQVAAAGVLRGYKDTRATMAITVVAYWVLGFPLSWMLGIYWGFGPIAVWVGLIAGLTAAAGMLYWRFLRISYNSAHAGV